jgi:hypothetical protein
MKPTMSLPVQLPSTARRALIALTAIGAIAAVAGAAIDPLRMWANWLLVSYYALTLALGGLCFVAIHYASGATWAVAIRRVPEALAAVVPLAAVGTAVVLIVKPELYPWSMGDFGPAPDAALTFKRAWLDRPFFLARAGTYAALWTFFTWAILRHSRLQDRGENDGRRTVSNRRLSGAFLAVFAVTFSLASFDWIMSLEPGWYSTIFAVYQFAGLFLSALAAVVLLALWLERMGPLAGVLHENHLHDFGKLVFAFSTFWAYIWFSQYMLIWYANIPEETTYFVMRMHGGWFAVFVLNVALNWIVPFAVLIRRDMKRDRRVLATIATVVLVGRWVDLYLMILPPIVGDRALPGPWEAGVFAAGAGLFGLAFMRALRARSIVPIGDPGLSASLRYES